MNNRINNKAKLVPKTLQYLITEEQWIGNSLNLSGNYIGIEGIKTLLAKWKKFPK